ncbi:MAG: helicase-exonuclease AddAB subunit AddA [Clostridiales bacterium]|nr:helicase-exonuclease AddAB subunit AddA [Clostridiales bacterium]
MRWTAGQQAAIDARNHSVLVSAAAGSGKTAVLVERVISLLREGGRIDRMLIVTFTRAAAGEMRERIAARLSKEGADSAHLRRQALRVNRAAICTLHVFCSRVIKKHFQAAGVDPMARIGDEGQLEKLKAQAMDQALEEALADPTKDEQALFLQLEQEQILFLMGQLYEFLMARADPWQWAKDHTGDDAAALSHWQPLLQDLCARQLEGARELLPAMEALLNQPGGPERYLPALDADIGLTHTLLEAAREGRLAACDTSFARLSTKKAAPDESPEVAMKYKALREEWKNRIKAARGMLAQNEARAEGDMIHTLPALKALCGLTEKMAGLYFSLKQKKNYLDYSDLEHLTLKALSQEAIRRQVAEEFDALFVDEYQDVSAIQEAIVNALHQGMNNTLFMVGDVKQSIYRFRQADPTLFLRKYQDYSLLEDAPCRKILLQQNFRSHENVLAAVNQVFRHAMREKETEIEYDEAAMLRPGGNHPFGAPVEIHLIRPQAEEEGEDEGELSQGYRYEAAFVAKKIKELIRTAQVHEGDTSRPLRYRDIALLVRYASGRAPYIARALQVEGIPVYSDADAQYFDLPEVAEFLQLLQVIDNPLQDLPLLSALRCPCFGFDEETLARIRLVERAPGTPFHQAFLAVTEKEGPLGDQARQVWRQLDHWRFLSRNLPLDQLIWRVLTESGLYMQAGAMEDGELRQANLRLLAQRAQGEAARQGLSAFLQDTGRLRAADDAASAKTLGENEDVVRILTMHKSKGLEFPVVFLLELARPFRKGGKEESLMRIHGEHGLAMQFIDGEKRISRDTCAMQALRGVNEREARAEEARLLYVGMTRARERLILVGSPRRLSASLEKWARPATAWAAGAASCMLDWVMQSLGGFRTGQSMADNGSIWRMAFQPAEDLSTPAPHRVIALPAFAEGPGDERVKTRLQRKIQPMPPLKTSVTALAKSLKREGDDWESPQDKRILPPDVPLPAFLQQDQISAVQRGVITHRVMGLMDYGLAAAGRWAAALAQLQQRGLLTEAEAEQVQRQWLRGFFTSPLGKRALAAREIHREWAFNLRYDQFSLVQGVIDLCFMEGDGWVLVDYKTDLADEETLLARYQGQIRWYARALAQITGAPVKEAVIFGLRRACAIPVSLRE